MSIHAPQDTLAFHAARPLCTYRDMGAVKCSNVADAIKAYFNKPGFTMATPEDQALRFYFMNHGRAIIARKYHPFEPLKPFDRLFVENYHTESNKMAIRAFYYLLLICVRESRHVSSDPSLYAELTKHFGKECVDFNKLIHHKGSDCYQRFLDNPPDASIGALTKSLRTIFYSGHFNPSFGGEAWGAIADCLVNFVDGTYSPEMMLDTVWTLCHNNGAIFNKGMLYNGYSHTLYRILDIQRSGQIAEAIRDDDQIQNFVSHSLTKLADDFRDEHSGEFGDHVDWFMVEAHGALHGPYNHEKSEQAAKYGLSEEQKAKLSELQKVKMAKIAATIEAKKHFAKNHFEYWPGQFAKILPKPKERAA